MCESPDSLQNICISFITENLYFVFDEIKDEQGNTIKLGFKSSSICFPPFVSELIFSSLDEKGLTDLTLSIFDPTITRLQRVFIQDASNVSTKGLRILRSHKISDLGVIGLNSITVNELIGCLGDWTLENLRFLNVSCSTFVSSERVKVFIAFSKLRNLKYLDVSFSEFNSQALEIVAQDLPVLESLNISGTMVTDIAPLKKCKDRLKFLDMFNLRLVPTCKYHYVSVLSELYNLQHLDISDDKENPYDVNVAANNAFSDFLKSPTCLPSLVSLDISGKDVDAEILKIFLENHPEMQFLGLLEVEACQDDIFCKTSYPVSSRQLKVTGSGTEEQTLESLRRYMQRKVYLQKCLCNLYSFIQNLVEVRLDIIKLVLQSMRMSPHLLGVQIAATACLYNLTKGGLSTQIHTSWLKQIVELTLISMENFPKQPQLQKNSLLTLCSDRMLDDVSFDRYHCAELVMNALMIFEDPAMNRMSVAICSILAAKISTIETSNLGAKESYMKRLLNIIKTKMELGEVDIMMKFTLSALWNLTDESPRTCKVFLRLGGMELFLDVLNKFPGDSTIETKVLGLLNNIAEVPYLRTFLVAEDFITALKSLLRSEHIDVSYFAAGIVAHITSDDELSWDCESVSWTDLVSELGTAVSSWQVPEMEMVAYRSFKPFYPLFSCTKAYQVQLWAAWAMHHVCSKNPQRYCHMILEGGGVEILQNVLKSTDTHSSVAGICKAILHFVEQNSKPQLCVHHVKQNPKTVL